MSLTFTHVRQTINLQEKVKIDSGEKIVQNSKIGRKKNIEFTISTKGNKFYAYFDGEKYAGAYNNQKDAEKIAKDYLKLLGEELEENRAKRDALRAMGRRSGKDAADIDTDATDKDREQADKNVIVQLRKVISLRGMKPVEFSNGKKVKLNPKDAEKILRIYQNLKPASKLQLQTFVSKSPENFKKAVSELKEEVLDEAPKMTYALVGTDMKIYSMGSDEGDLRLDRKSLEKRFKDVAPLKMARLKTAQSIGDKVDKSQLKEEVELDEIKEPFAVVDTADGNKIVGTASDEKGAKSIITTSQLPPMKIKDKKTLKIVKVKKKQMIGQPIKEEALDEALPPHLAKLFDKDGNFKDPKKQKVFDRMMGDGIGKEIAQKMGRIKFRVQADSAKKKLKVYVDSNDEQDAQKALKNHPAYISGAMRVIPENFSEALEEGKMKQLHDLISQGKSAQQIAKMLKLDVKTIQALMDETDLDEFFGRVKKKVMQSNIQKVLSNIASNKDKAPREVKFQGGKIAKITPAIASAVADYLEKKNADGDAVVKKADNWDEFKKIIKSLRLPEPHLVKENSIVSEKGTPYVYKSFNEFVVHHGDKQKLTYSP
jgi:hypothetical protein